MLWLKDLTARVTTFVEQQVARTRETPIDADLRHQLTLLSHVDTGCHNGAELMSRASRSERLLFATRLQHLEAEGFLKRQTIRPPAGRSDIAVRHE